MSSCAARYVVEIFQALNVDNIRYAVLRDLTDTLPYDYNGDTDVDIIVHPDDWGVARTLLRRQRWFEVLHPFDNLVDFTFLYGMNRFHFFIRGHAKVDICFQLACRSTNAGEWVPLDQKIQDSVWRNREWDELRKCFVLSPLDECVHLLARAFFDKKSVSELYKVRIENLWLRIEEVDLKERLELVFFNAAPEVISCIRSSDLNSLVSRVLGFHDY